MGMPNASAPIEKKSFFDPAIIFFIVSLLIGGLYCIAIPYGAGFDEEAHIVRIYDISGNNFIANRNPPSFKHTLTYSEFHDLSYQRRDVQSPAFDMFTTESFGQKFSRREESVLYGYTTNSIYSPINFLPQAVIARIFWRIFDFPIFPVVILARLAGLLLYAVGGYLAIRLLPYGKWALMALALSPLALFQAATLNTDGFLNVVSFLFYGLTFYIFAKAAQTKPGWVWALFGVSLLLGASKLGAIILLPLLLLPISKLRSKKLIGVLVFGAVLAILLNIGWAALALPNSRLADSDSGNLSDMVGQMVNNFGDILLGFIKSMVASFGLYMRNWMASYGYWVGVVPRPVYWFYILFLIAALFAEPISEKLPTKTRFFSLGMFFLASATVIGMYFLSHYTPGVISEIRQGRYSIPYTPLLLITLCGLVTIRETWRKAAEFMAVACLLVVLGYYSFGLYATYYTDCGYPAYAGEKCVLPIYKNLEITGARQIKINAATPVRQKFTALCTGLESVHVFIKSIPKDGAGTLRFTLLDANQQKLAGKDIPASQIQPGEYLPLPVSSTSDVRGTSYEIFLESLDVPAPDGFGVIFQPKDVYAGDLSIAGKISQADLVIHYACTGP